MELTDALVLYVCGWRDDQSKEMYQEALDTIHTHRKKLYLERKILDASNELNQITAPTA